MCLCLSCKLSKGRDQSASPWAGTLYPFYFQNKKRSYFCAEGVDKVTNPGMLILDFHQEEKIIIRDIIGPSDKMQEGRLWMD